MGCHGIFNFQNLTRNLRQKLSRKFLRDIDSNFPIICSAAKLILLKNKRHLRFFFSKRNTKSFQNLNVVETNSSNFINIASKFTRQMSNPISKTQNNFCTIVNEFQIQLCSKQCLANVHMDSIWFKEIINHNLGFTLQRINIPSNQFLNGINIWHGKSETKPAESF